MTASGLEAHCLVHSWQLKQSAPSDHQRTPAQWSMIQPQEVTLFFFLYLEILFFRAVYVCRTTGRIISLLPISPIINILHCCGTLVAIDEPMNQY